MIQTIIDTLNDKLPFHTKRGLAEIVEIKGRKRPMYYVTGGEWKDVEVDQFPSVSYWRKADVTQSETDSVSGCTTEIERTYLLTLVAIVNRKELECDDAYADDRVADEVVSKLTGVDVALRKAIGARSAKTFISSYVTDNERIESREYTGVKMRHKFVYLSLEVEVEVVVSPDCIGLC